VVPVVAKVVARQSSTRAHRPQVAALRGRPRWRSNMAKRSKIKFKKMEKVEGDAKQRAEIILRNHDNDVSRAMEYCAAVEESREVLEIINPLPPEYQ
jgi:hypothetical protein